MLGRHTEGAHFRKLIVTDFATVDGSYEAPGNRIQPLFEYYQADYDGDDTFDDYNAERLRAAVYLRFSDHRGRPHAAVRGPPGRPR